MLGRLEQQALHRDSATQQQIIQTWNNRTDRVLSLWYGINYERKRSFFNLIFYNNCRNPRALIGLFLLSISGQTISGQTFIIYNLCDIDATSESRKFEKSICHFLTNRKRPFFPLANKRGRRIMNLVASDWINFDLILSPLPFCYCKKQMDVSFSCVCPVIDNEFRHNIVKVVCGSTWLSPRGSTATLTMLWRNSWSITGQTHEKLTSIC